MVLPHQDRRIQAQERKKELYKTYLEERRVLIDARYRAIDARDKALLTLSSGALGLSVTFMDKIADPIWPETEWCLILGWCSFAGSIGATLLAFFFSKNAHDQQIRDTEKILLESESGIEESASNQWSKYSSICSATFLFIGIIFTIIFAAKNL